MKVNSEQLLFNWQLGRDLVLRKSEEKWGKGIVEQLSLDLQHEFPEVRGFSARNLWNMKKWYSFYALARTSGDLIHAVDDKLKLDSIKLQQIGAEISFPSFFGFVPWRHHVEIVSRCNTVERHCFIFKELLKKAGAEMP